MPRRLLVAVVTQGMGRYIRLLSSLKYIRTLVEEVARYPGFAKPDIIVVSREYVYLDDYSGVKQHVLPGSNIPEARNYALRIARSAGYDYLLFVDDDVLVNPQLVEHAVKCMDDKTAMVSSSLYIYYGKLEPPTNPFTDKPRCLEVDMVSTAATLLDVNKIPDNLWFNPKLEVGEDNDFCRRIRKKGLKVKLVSGLYSIHWKLHHREYAIYYKHA